MSEQYTFYDLPTNDSKPQPWSLNPWKARMSLNFKGADYKTEWTEYPDIAPKMKEFGVPPNSGKGETPYTIPVCRFDSKTIIMDSKAIVTELEKRHPSPSLNLESPYVDKVSAVMGDLFPNLAAFVLPKVPAGIPKRSAEYFEETRAQAFGMPLKQFNEEKGTPEAWSKCEETIKRWVPLLKENEGPYLEGKSAGFADFIIATFLIFMKFCDGDKYQKILAIDPVFQKLVDGCAKWAERND